MQLLIRPRVVSCASAHQLATAQRDWRALAALSAAGAPDSATTASTSRVLLSPPPTLGSVPLPLNRVPPAALLSHCVAQLGAAQTRVSALHELVFELQTQAALAQQVRR